MGIFNDGYCDSRCPVYRCLPRCNRNGVCNLLLRTEIERTKMKTILLKMLLSKVLKGKLTYIGIAGVAVPMIGQLLGLELADSDVATVVQGIGIVVAAFGRWRAAHQEKL